MADTVAEILLPTSELRDDIPFYTKVLGMKLDMIYPADDPRVGVFSGHGLRVRIDRDAQTAPGVIRILTDDPDGFAAGQRDLAAPNGTRVLIDARNPPLVMPATVHSFVVRRLKDQAPWIIGRAGMQYRDLVPDRLGGSIIASHIRIPDGGPVPDMVHFHKVGFQLIFCIHGWVDVVYEDQGDKMRLTAGDCFIQPPEIRHRVLEASDNVQVIEIGVPAEHVTEIDHDMRLPTPHYRPEREWDGQRFVYNTAEGAAWQAFRLPGFLCRDTTIAENTKGVAGVQVVRPAPDGGTSPWAAHDTDIHFAFVMAGTVTLEGEGRAPYDLEQGDAFVIPPHMKTRLSAASADLEILEVTLPGQFDTTLEQDAEPQRA
ncbi:cupin domain-containing protein [Epibacterium sp. Ofav1-8]|uniref:cupin domain-containing protein n=1 Tax=Epibacterium sp. Ofav1-8 TaxID=2917735 RepID=UPI001EF5894B|nr:cupin domain-containing protein [Epibacterium sp. Ofav1-8]MCG7622332.1 cupin domain-containing protein [Epibacterium sp. Ofav1-8]